MQTHPLNGYFKEEIPISLDLYRAHIAHALAFIASMGGPAREFAVTHNAYPQSIYLHRFGDALPPKPSQVFLCFLNFVSLHKISLSTLCSLSNFRIHFGKSATFIGSPYLLHQNFITKPSNAAPSTMARSQEGRILQATYLSRRQGLDFPADVVFLPG